MTEQEMMDQLNKEIPIVTAAGLHPGQVFFIMSIYEKWRKASAR
jgi:hypothetical protein